MRNRFGSLRAAEKGDAPRSPARTGDKIIRSPPCLPSFYRVAARRRLHHETRADR